MKRYNHNRSNTRLQDGNMGELAPTRASHCIAGTTLKGGVYAAMELAPMVHQTLGSIRTDCFAIAIADRLIWDDAEDFYTGGEDGKQRPVPPYIVAPEETGWLPGSLADKLGFPTGVPGLKCNALPFRLYAFWINENCINPQVQDKLPFATTSGLDVVTNTELFNMNWPKDMFTTGTVDATLGDDVVIPLAVSAPVVGNGMTLGLTDGTNNGGLLTSTANAQPLTVRQTNYGQDVGSSSGSGTLTGVTVGVTTDPEKSGMVSDLTESTGILPDDFNFAMSQARWKSRRNLFGARYKDWLRFLGIRYSDKRLDLPSTLAHGKSMIDVSGVLQTAPGSGSYVGQAAGRGTGFASCKYKTYFEEPTTVIHLVCVRPAPVYVNMNPVEWQWEVREDLFTPEFAHVGMVEEKVGTLFPTGVEEADSVRFNFRNRYDEMRSGFNSVAGKFKTTNASYHMGRMFETAPAFNSDFLECNPTNRVFADLNAEHIEAIAVRNEFIERNMVTPDGNPHYN